MIKLVDKVSYDDSGNEGLSVLLEVDGVAVTRETEVMGDDQPIDLHVKNIEAYAKIAQHRFSDIPPVVDKLVSNVLAISAPQQSTQSTLQVSIFCYEGPKYKIEIILIPNFSHWKLPYSMSEWVAEVVRLVCEGSTDLISKSLDGIEGTQFFALFECFVADPSQNIGDFFNIISRTIEEAARLAAEDLETRARKGTLSTYFSFSPETQSACEQYLLYFGEFLRDLGIDTSIQLKEEAGRVLFSVTPKDKDEALEHIREALEVYIGLPAASIISEGQGYRLEIQKLEANVMHFKSQLMLASAMLEAKQTTIEALREKVDYQSQIIEGRILIESRQEQFESQGDKEELLKGTVALTKYKGKGLEINLPKLYRMLKELFQRKA